MTTYTGYELVASRAFSENSAWNLSYKIADEAGMSSGTMVYGVTLEWTRSATGEYQPDWQDDVLGFSGTLYTKTTIPASSGDGYLYIYNSIGSVIVIPSNLADAISDLITNYAGNGAGDMSTLFLSNSGNDVEAMIRKIANSIPKDSATQYAWKDVKFTRE